MKPSEKAADRLRGIGAIIQRQADGVAKIIAVETNCDKDYVDPEPDFREVYPTPWSMVRYDAGHVTLEAVNGHILTGCPVRVGSPLDMAYRHAAKLVNECEAD